MPDRFSSPAVDRQDRPRSGGRFLRWLWLALMAALVLTAGCAKYNTYYNAKKAFDDAEHERNEAIRQHQDPPKPTGQQKTNYETAARKAQKVLDEYPGSGLTDDALFLQGKAYYRLDSYRMSIRKFDLLFSNFPATPYMEEALYLQALNYLLIGAVDRSQDYLDLLAKQFPDSEYQAETLKVSGDNAYTLEKWEEAAASYQAYLDNFKGGSERERIGLKLAECYWELRDYDKAAVILQEVGNTTTSAELAFRSRLLRARVHARMGDFEVAELLLGELENEAEIYHARGDVALIRAESLVAQGKGDEASPLLENMPAEWETPDIKARAAEILGNLYLERGDLEQARIQFQDSLRRKTVLEDENRCRVLNQTLADYLAAEQALPDAKPERVPRLKLLQANSMLFGFDRPEMAAQLYAQAAGDTAADSTCAARALFGAALTYRQYLDQPDSAAMFAATLEERFPDSPQAYELRLGSSGDLLGYLLDHQEKQQAERYANLTPEELEELNSYQDLTTLASTGKVNAHSGVRRRLIYLSRRPNILVEPSPEILQAAAARRTVPTAEPVAEQSVPADGTGLPGPAVTARQLAPPSAAPGDSTVIPGVLAAPDSTLILRSDILGPDGRPLTQPAAVDSVRQGEEEKKKKDPNRFDLR